jgi:3-isopropylmalate/(R)-2-methylmalate dehydratase large subunit
MTGHTLFEKVWQRNIVRPETAERPAILHIGLHLIHEVTSPQAFAELDRRGMRIRRPDLVLATLDHSTPTLPADREGHYPYATPAAEQQVETLRRNCARHGIELFDLGDDRRGIVHVVGPELGRTQPGMTIVCGDSHTSTHGAFGALAFGIGTTEVGHVLGTQSLWQRRPKTMRIRVDGTLPAGVTAKDLALHILSVLGAAGATGHVIEYCGDAVRSLSMEGRMTLCNLSIEAGARAGMIAPDETTFAYLRDRAGAPPDFDAAIADWRMLASDHGARFDAELTIDGGEVGPMATFGTTPDTGIRIGHTVPAADEYMRFAGGQSLESQPVDRVFVGSCTNGRIEDLRSAARILRGRQVSEKVRMLVVPGSEKVKRAAEAEGLDVVFTAAGAEWREPGCSMCIAMNGDRGAPGELVVSTSNRNFKGRQGEGVRTVLASPATAAAAAIAGHIVDPRTFDRRDHDH